MKIIDINGRERECQNAFLDSSWPGFITVKFTSLNRPGYSHTEWYPLKQFIANNPTLAHLTKGKTVAPPPEIAGVVSSAKPDSLSDKTQNWQNNIYAGYNLWISRGKGESQTRIIMENTKNRLIIDKPWDIKPDKTSQYTILLHLGSTDQKGNTLPG